MTTERRSSRATGILEATHGRALPPHGEGLLIKTFTSSTGMTSQCDVVKFGLEPLDGELLEIEASVVPIPSLNSQSMNVRNVLI